MFFKKYRHFVIRSDLKEASLLDILQGSESAVKMRGAVVRENPQYGRKNISKNEWLRILEAVIRHNYFTFNKKSFLQTKGIPQGLNVS